MMYSSRMPAAGGVEGPEPKPALPAGLAPKPNPVEKDVVARLLPNPPEMLQFEEPG